MRSQTQRTSSYALITCNNQVMLSQLSRGSNKGKWNLVGGGIEFGESPYEALVREVDEEAGIQITGEPPLIGVVSRCFSYTNSSGQEQSRHLIGIVYWLELDELAECRTGPDGHSSAGCNWFDIDSLDPDQVVSSVFKALELARQK